MLTKILHKQFKNINRGSTQSIYRFKKRFYVERSIVEARGMYDDSSKIDGMSKKKGYFSMKALTDVADQYNCLLLQGSGCALQWPRCNYME